MLIAKQKQILYCKNWHFIFNILKFYKHRHRSLDINIKFMNLLKDNRSGRKKPSRTKLSNIKPWIYLGERNQRSRTKLSNIKPWIYLGERKQRSRTKLSNIKPWIYHTKIKLQNASVSLLQNSWMQWVENLLLKEYSWK